MNDKASSETRKSEPLEETVSPDQNTAESQPQQAVAQTEAEPVNNITQCEEETDRKQDESIASLAEQTDWIATQTKWIRYQVIASTFLGAMTLFVLFYHGWIMRRQSQAMTDQTILMRGQLDSMNSGSSQTQQMITAMQKQADAATSQAGTSQALAEQNKELVTAGLAQAEAARRGAEIAQQSFYIGDRPYLGAKALIDKFEEGATPTITVVFENTGKTPALDFQSGATVDVDKTPNPNIEKYRRMSKSEFDAQIAAEIKALRFPSMPRGSNTFLGAGDKVIADVRGPALSAKLIRDIKSMEVFLFVWGGATYKDGLGKSHELSFCLFYDPESDIFVTCPTFNTIK